MIEFLAIIKSWFFGVLEGFGINTFLADIGVWPTLFLSVLIGSLVLLLVFGLLYAISKIENVALKIILVLLCLVVFSLFFYIYVDAVIFNITALGGLL